MCRYFMRCLPSRKARLDHVGVDPPKFLNFCFYEKKKFRTEQQRYFPECHIQISNLPHYFLCFFFPSKLTIRSVWSEDTHAQITQDVTAVTGKKGIFGVGIFIPRGTSLHLYFYFGVSGRYSTASFPFLFFFACHYLGALS